MFEPVFNHHFLQLIRDANAKLNGTASELPSLISFSGHDENSGNDRFNINNLIKTFHIAKQLNNLFPGVFIKKEFISTQELSWLSKLKLKTNGIQFIRNQAAEIIITTFAYHPIYLYVQLLHYTKAMQNSIAQFTLVESIKHWSKPTCHLWLNDKLGEGYSRGRLIDLADHVYDEYKHTQLSPIIFRTIFFSFLQCTPEIGNIAFDNYTDSRDTHQAWEKAIHNYLSVNFSLAPKQSGDICTLLFKNV